MELVVIKAELEREEGVGGINDGANGCAVETVEPDGTASVSSVFITLQGTEGERQGAVSAMQPSALSCLQHLSQSFLPAKLAFIQHACLLTCILM